VSCDTCKYCVVCHPDDVQVSVCHVRYLSHLSLQVGSSNWVHKTQIHSPFKDGTTLAPKLANPLSPLERWLYPFYYWIKYSWSGSTHILYYINLLVRWNTLLRNQILSCQHIFYYIIANFILPSDSKLLSKLDFTSCEELRAHGVTISGYFKVNGVSTYCSNWSENFVCLIYFWHYLSSY